MKARKINVSEAARQLGVSRIALTRVVNGKAALSLELARRLEAWLGTPGAATWLYAQVDWDLWQADQAGGPAGVCSWPEGGV